ncbi:protein PIN-LIKES 7-like [Iris pallida]|uniref:Protein PIN-LIKES 7-like n=1 Tax=Iris pallida TaxID=29817 RepID=A0AAX6F083_IRIPA|nr:protein PIN-LIKES 7-like [Iris pallida]
MGFISLLAVASMPILQFLLIGLLGAFLASPRSNILSPDARRDINKVVFYVFSPAIIFSSLAKNVTFHQLVSWWFMPVNIAIIFSIGSILGWVAVKMVRPEPHLEKLVIASCSAGNLGNLMLIVIPSVCKESDNPFGETSVCNSHALSYVSLSMALGGFFIWTHTYSLMRKVVVASSDELSVPPAKMGGEEDEASLVRSGNLADEAQRQMEVPLLASSEHGTGKVHFWHKVQETLEELVKELMSPATIGAIFGFVVGVIPWLKSLIIGDAAPLRVIQDSLILLGDGMVPCTTLVLGGNLTKEEGKYDEILCRVSQVGRKDLSVDVDNRSEVRAPPACGDRSSESCGCARIPTTGSSVQLCATDTVRSATSNGYWYNGSTVQRGSGRVLGDVPVDLLVRCSSTDSLVDHLHVHLVLKNSNPADQGSCDRAIIYLLQTEILISSEVS